MNEKDCTKKKCRFFDKKMSQNCARALNRHSDMPYASICKDRLRRPSKWERLLKALLKSMSIADINHRSAFGLLSDANNRELIKIKESMK